jgi:RNA polymerase sigma-70 factor (ECF subfamily)
LFVQGHDVAEEVTQSVFVTVASKLSGGEYTEQGRFESWLFRVAMNRIRDEVRRTRRQATPTDPEALDGQAGRTGGVIGGAGETGGESGTADHRDELTALRNAMSQLTDQDREIVELRHHAGLSFKQMADLLSEPLGTLLARHHRALRKLKDLMPGGSAQPAHTTGDTP